MIKKRIKHWLVAFFVGLVILNFTNVAYAVNETDILVVKNKIIFYGMPTSVHEYMKKNRSNDVVRRHYRDIPILMYHDIAEERHNNSTIVTPKKFKSDMTILKNAGYEAIRYQDLVDFVRYGKELPDQPILITFDDGYSSNYDYAYPILKALKLKATISIIGISVGVDEYKETGAKITPHFTINQGREMLRSGVIDIQSHTYEMHDVPFFDKESPREGAVIMVGESEKAFKKALEVDYSKMKQLIEESLKGDMFVVTYPYGFHDDLTELTLKELKNKVTVTTIHGVNRIVLGDSNSLKKLKRINVTEWVSGHEIISMIEKQTLELEVTE